MGGIFGGGGGSGGGLISDNGLLGGMLGAGQNIAGINLSGIPFIGGMFPNQNEKAMRQAMANAAGAYQAARPQLASAYNQALGNIMGAFSPAQQALSQMYGGKATQQSAAPQSQARAPTSQAAPQVSGGGGGMGLFDSIGLGQNAPFGLPGPGLSGILSGNVAGNLPGMGWKGPGGIGAGLPGMPSGGIGGLPGLGALNSVPNPQIPGLSSLINGAAKGGGLLGGIL